MRLKMPTADERESWLALRREESRGRQKTNLR
jgi:hypothetical protein